MKHCAVLLLKAPTVYSSTQRRSVAGSFFKLNVSMGSLGLVMLATVLDKEGYAVRVCYPRTVQDAVDLVAQHTPKVVGVSSETINFPQAREIPAHLDKAGYGGIFKVIGGYHATFEPEESLKAGYDCVVLREGEETFLELVNAVLSHQPIENIHGIAFLNSSGKVVRTPSRSLIADLDQLPIPNWELSDLRLPKYLGIIYATRGCPHRCSFCVSSEFYGHKPRYRSADSIVEEIQSNDYRVVYFQDDDFTRNLERVQQLHSLLSKLPHQPVMVVYSRMDTIAKYPDLAVLLAEMGVRLIYFGIESHHQQGLNSIGKGLRAEEQEAAIKISKRAGINIWASLMVLPHETRSSWRDTVGFVKDLAHPPISTVGVCTPFPGTALYEKLVSENRLLHRQWEYYDGLHCVFKPYRLQPLEIEELMLWGDSQLNTNPVLRYGAGVLASLPDRLRYMVVTLALTGRIR
jgi:anaerobic magnesium-protoporphyrin IX monomethyl ester cyclase